MVENCGISFGVIFPGLKLVVGLVLIGLSLWWISNVIRNREMNLGWLLVIVGGWGNFGQRFVNSGCVIDNLNIPLLSIKNNLADWLIFLGVVLVIGVRKWKNQK
jgi:lipoprotein signal peptidase